MKFVITMKDPDALHEAVSEAVHEEVHAMGLKDPDEMEVLEDVRVEKVLEACKKWFRWDEYLRVEVDTEAGTCVVLPASDD